MSCLSSQIIHGPAAYNCKVKSADVIMAKTVCQMCVNCVKMKKKKFFHVIPNKKMLSKLILVSILYPKTSSE